MDSLNERGGLVGLVSERVEWNIGRPHRMPRLVFFVEAPSRVRHSHNLVEGDQGIVDEPKAMDVEVPLLSEGVEFVYQFQCLGAKFGACGKAQPRQVLEQVETLRELLLSGSEDGFGRKLLAADKEANEKLKVKLQCGEASGYMADKRVCLGYESFGGLFVFVHAGGGWQGVQDCY